MLTQVQIDECFFLGYDAAKFGKPRAPALNKKLMNKINNLSTSDFKNHDEIIKIMDSFSRGYQKFCNEEAATLL